MAKTRRSYKGGAASTTIGTSIAASGATTFTIAAYTGWPYGSAPFFVVVEPGTSNEEKMLVTRTGSTDTTINIYSTPSVAANRGMDGTTSYLHASGSTVYPVFTATDADEANELASTLTTQGDILIHGASTFGRVGIGTAAQVLRVNSSATAPEWGQVATAGIADDAVTAAKIATGAVGADEIAANAVGASELADDAVDTAAIVNLAVTTGKLADGAVTTSKIADSNVTLAKLATAVQNLLIPAGTISATIKSTADTGWLLLDGASIAGADLLYPSLWPIAPASWKSGTTLNLPTMANKMLEGQSTTALGASGGSNTVTIASGNLPTHVHSIDPPITNLTLSDLGHSHTSGVTIRTSSGTFGGAASGHGGTAITDAADANISSNTTGITGSVNIEAFNSADGGFANTALTITNAHLAVNFQIKAH
jgi:hypothetical protein